MLLPRALADTIVAHARAEAPNESCGLVFGGAAFGAGGAALRAGAAALRYVACRNRLASRYRYEIHPEDLLREVTAADDAGEALWGIVHSHVATPAVPSPTDIGLATWPGALQLIVSLAGDPGEPGGEGGVFDLRAWRITADEAVEVRLEIA